MGRRMKKATKDNIAIDFLNYLEKKGSATARIFVSSDEARKYNLTGTQFSMLFREYRDVEPYLSLIGCDSRNKGSIVYQYKGD